jgi:hypothetical protein
MGQRVPAVLYGITTETPRQFKRCNDGDWQEHGLLAEYEDVVLDWKDAPTLDEDVEPADLGFYVAVKTGGDRGEPDFEKLIPMDKIPAAYPESYANAVAKWNEFADWCKREKGVELPPAKLYLTETETA